MKIITPAIIIAMTCLLSCQEENVDASMATPGTMIMTVNESPYSEWFADSPDHSAKAHNYVERLDIEADLQRKFNGAVVEEGILLISLVVLAEGQFWLRGNCTSAAEPGSVSFRSGSEVYASWEVDRFFVGTVTITRLDLKNKLISGTFRLSLTGTFDQEVLKTEGSFTDLPIF